MIDALNDNKPEMSGQAQLVVYHLHLQRSIEMKKCIGVIAPRIPHSPLEPVNHILDLLDRDGFHFSRNALLVSTARLEFVFSMV